MSVLARASPTRPSSDPTGVKESVEAIISPTAANPSRTRRAGGRSSLTATAHPSPRKPKTPPPHRRRFGLPDFGDRDHPTRSYEPALVPELVGAQRAGHRRMASVPFTLRNLKEDLE